MRAFVPLLLALMTLLAPGAARASAADAPPALGVGGLMGPDGEGWGRAHPRRVSNGGAPSGRIERVRWRRWGTRVAAGRGRTSVYKPGGGYYDKPVPVRVRALRLRTCPSAPDRRAYTRMIVSHRVRPGGPWTAWGPWTLDLCNFASRPKPCRPVVFRSGGHGASDIGAWDVRCRVARRLARASRRVAIRRRRGPSGPAEYARRWHGFACAGYSLSATSEAARISWTCHRGTAQVTFKRY